MLRAGRGPERFRRVGRIRRPSAAQAVHRQWRDGLATTQRSLALPYWAALMALADGLVAKSADQYQGWGDAVIFEACTAARIGEVSGCLVRDINTDDWIWTVRRQTTPSPGELQDGRTTASGGGLVDRNTKGRRARQVPLIDAIRDLVQRRIDLACGDPDARLFTGPRGGRITTATLRDATCWDEVVTKLGYEELKRHSLRHTGLTWMGDAGVPVHVLRKIAGHADLSTTQRYLHPDRQSVAGAGELLSYQCYKQPLTCGYPTKNRLMG